MKIVTGKFKLSLSSCIAITFKDTKQRKGVCKETEKKWLKEYSRKWISSCTHKKSWIEIFPRLVEWQASSFEVIKLLTHAEEVKCALHLPLWCESLRRCWTSHTSSIVSSVLFISHTSQCFRACSRNPLNWTVQTINSKRLSFHVLQAL